MIRRGRTLLSILITLLVTTLPCGAEFASENVLQTANSHEIDNQEVVAVQDVISQVKKALGEAQTTLAGKNLFRIKTVTLTLQTVATKKIGGTLKLWVITFGHEIQQETTQQIVIQLGRPGTPKAGLQSTVGEELVKAIVTASEGVKNAEVGPFPLQAQKLSIDLSFVITRDTTAGGSFQITPVTLELKGDFKKQATHKIALEFDTAQTPPTSKPESQ